ncbi:MAG: formylglycine-generating enzyme family protein [Pseudomonadota bacterium]
MKITNPVTVLFVACTLLAASVLWAGQVKIGVDTSWRPIPEDVAPDGSGAMGSSFTNSLGMKFVWCPPGTYMMGSPSSEPGRYDNETQHQVTLTRGFHMQTTEVTQGQWNKVMGSNPSHFEDCGADCPVEKVSWDDAQEFIKKLNRMEGKTYRLPTEAQWEYAARAGSVTAFANGGIIEMECGHDPSLSVIGWYCGNASAKTHPVAQKQVNAWGLYDMYGNVYEWCLDWYDGYPSGSVTDPTGPSSGSYRVFRGGCWNNYARICRSANRIRYDPGDRNYNLGFRLSLPAVR